ncbi:MAG: hypothetical protein V3R25_10280 [Nitrosomonadaceae bacterium]
MGRPGRGKQNKRLGKADPEWQAKTRQKIQDSHILNVVIDHALGKNDITSTRLKACEMLLNKALPNLQSTDIKMEALVEHAEVHDKMPTAEEWKIQNEIKETEEKLH